MADYGQTDTSYTDASDEIDVVNDQLEDSEGNHCSKTSKIQTLIFRNSNSKSIWDALDSEDRTYS